MVKQVHCSQRRLLRRGLEFHVCTINKSAYTKKSLVTYLMILVYTKMRRQSMFILFDEIYTGWNDKIVVPKKTTLQLNYKTFIEKINSANLIM